jgi:hypothetical protein
MKSTMDKNFLIAHPSVEKTCFSFLSKLFSSPLRCPGECGDGICLSSDSCYGNPVKLNIDKTNYLRQSFAKTDEKNPTNNKDTRTACTYGVGTGGSTHGQTKK